MIAEICYASRKLKSVLYFIANYDFRCETPISFLSYFSMNLFNEGFNVRGVLLDIPEVFDKVKHECFNSNCSNMVGKALCIFLRQ